MQTVIEPSWQAWIAENLQRQCSPLELCQILKQHGFSIAHIQQLLGEAYPSEFGEALPPIDYIALANPPLGRFNPDLRIQQVLAEPLQLYVIEDFLNGNECQRLIEITDSQLSPSEVSHDNGDYAYRTSQTCHLVNTGHPLVEQVNEKIARTLGIQACYAEPIQAQRYAVGQEFKQHHDYFAPNTDIYERYAKDLGQRTWTFVVYLNDVVAGGATHFPMIETAVKPKRGCAALWNNLHADGRPNYASLHQGMPVVQGVKYIITQWFRERGQGAMFYTEAD
jgi:prolyl 4-hydroxylase